MFSHDTTLFLVPELQEPTAAKGAERSMLLRTAGQREIYRRPNFRIARFHTALSAERGVSLSPCNTQKARLQIWHTMLGWCDSGNSASESGSSPVIGCHRVSAAVVPVRPATAEPAATEEPKASALK